MTEEKPKYTIPENIPRISLPNWMVKCKTLEELEEPVLDFSELKKESKEE